MYIVWWKVATQGGGGRERGARDRRLHLELELGRELHFLDAWGKINKILPCPVCEEAV